MVRFVNPRLKWWPTLSTCDPTAMGRWAPRLAATAGRVCHVQSCMHISDTPADFGDAAIGHILGTGLECQLQSDAIKCRDPLAHPVVRQELAGVRRTTQGAVDNS